MNTNISVGEPETGSQDFLQGAGVRAGKENFREPEPVKTH